MGGIRLLANSCQVRLAELGGSSWSSTGSSPTVPDGLIEWGRTLSTAGSRTIGVGSQSAWCRADLLACGGREGVRGGEGEKRARRGRQGREKERERIAACDTTNYVIVWVQPVVTGSTARHSTTQYNTGTDVRKGERDEKSRHIRSSQVRLQEKVQAPDKNAVEGGRGQGGSFDVVD